MNQRSPIAIAVAVVRHEGTVLIGLRPEGKPLAGYWEFPGGKIRSGESPEQAAVRECLEETGIAVDVTRTLAVVDHHYEHGTLQLHFMDALPLGAGIPHTPFRWSPITELGNYRFPPANASVLEMLQAEGSWIRRNSAAPRKN